MLSVCAALQAVITPPSQHPRRLAELPAAQLQAPGKALAGCRWFVLGAPTLRLVFRTSLAMEGGATQCAAAEQQLACLALGQPPAPACFAAFCTVMSLLERNIAAGSAAVGTLANCHSGHLAAGIQATARASSVQVLGLRRAGSQEEFAKHGRRCVL